MLNALNMWFTLVAFATDVDRHSGDIKHMPIHTTMYSRQWFGIMVVVCVFNPENFYNTNVIDRFRT